MVNSLFKPLDFLSFLEKRINTLRSPGPLGLPRSALKIWPNFGHLNVDNMRPDIGKKVQCPVGRKLASQSSIAFLTRNIIKWDTKVAKED